MSTTATLAPSLLSAAATAALAHQHLDKLDTTLGMAASTTPTAGQTAGQPLGQAASGASSSIATLEPVPSTASRSRATAAAEAVASLVAKILDLIRAVVRWVVSCFRLPAAPKQAEDAAENAAKAPGVAAASSTAKQASSAHMAEQVQAQAQEVQQELAQQQAVVVDDALQAVLKTPYAASMHSVMTAFSHDLAQAVSSSLIRNAQHRGTPQASDADAAKTLEDALSQLRARLEAQEKKLAKKLDQRKEGVSEDDRDRIKHGHLPQQNTPAAQEYQRLHSDLQALQACLMALNGLAPAPELVAQARTELQTRAREEAKRAEEAAKQPLLDAAKSAPTEPAGPADPADHAKLRKHFSCGPAGTAEGSAVFKKLAALHADEDGEPNDEPPRERPRG
jgi:hypothetical protein